MHALPRERRAAPNSSWPEPSGRARFLMSNVKVLLASPRRAGWRAGARRRLRLRRRQRQDERHRRDPLSRAVYLACQPNCHFFIVLISTKHCPPAPFALPSPSVVSLSLSFVLSRSRSYRHRHRHPLPSLLSILFHSLFVHRTDIRVSENSLSLSFSACAVYFSLLSLSFLPCPT